MTIAVLIITIIALLFAIAAMVFFRLKAPTVGAVFATLALFLALADVKAFQFRKMASSPMTIPPRLLSLRALKSLAAMSPTRLARVTPWGGESLTSRATRLI